MATNDYKISKGVVYPPPTLASNEEFTAGTSETASPSVKQVKDEFVSVNKDQTIHGTKTFDNSTPTERTEVYMNSSGAADDMYWAASIIQQRNGVNVGFIESGIDLTNQNNPFVQIGAVRFIDGQPIYSVLNASVAADGTRYSHAPTPPNNATGNVIATVEWVQQNSLPTGTIITWSTSTAPAGYLICDGSAISRTTYAALFNVIGTIYGSGDGNTTFNLPNVDDATLWQQGSRQVGQRNRGGLPNIKGNSLIRVGRTHSVSPGFTGATAATEAATTTSYVTSLAGSVTNTEIIGYFNAANSSATYGRYGDNNDSVVPESINVMFCIKY